MINKEKSLLLGTISKPHGTRGAVLLWLRNIKADDIRKRDSAFVEIDGWLVPFFIESFKISSAESVIIKFEGIDDETKARGITGNAVYVSPAQVKSKRESSGEFQELTGYQVFDSKLGFVGIAGEIADIANNPLLKVTREGKEFLIPIHEDIILEVNDKVKEIKIDAPEGLFEL